MKVDGEAWETESQSGLKIWLKASKKINCRQPGDIRVPVSYLGFFNSIFHQQLLVGSSRSRPVVCWLWVLAGGWGWRDGNHIFLRRVKVETETRAKFRIRENKQFRWVFNLHYIMHYAVLGLLSSSIWLRPEHTAICKVPPILVQSFMLMHPESMLSNANNAFYHLVTDRKSVV